MKKLLLLATTAVLAGAIAPVASASWYHEGSPISSDTTVHFTGTTYYSGNSGILHCPEITATILLTAGSTVGHFEEFRTVNPTSCDVMGGLAVLAGGTNSLTSTQFTKGTVEINGDQLNMFDFEIHYTFKNGLKQTLKTTGTEAVKFTPDDASAISHLSFVGNFDNSLGEVMKWGGSLTPTEQGTYGLTP